MRFSALDQSAAPHLTGELPKGNLAHVNSTTTATLAVLALLIGCSKQEAAKKTSGPIVIKGLFIGMHTNQLANVIANKWGEGWSMSPAAFDNDWWIAEHAANWPNSAQVRLKHSDARIETIVFDNKASEMLFRCSDMGASQFVQTFIDSYGIPRMEPQEQWWEYLSPQGVRFRIGKDKAVLIQAFDAEQAKKGFD